MIQRTFSRVCPVAQSVGPQNASSVKFWPEIPENVAAPVSKIGSEPVSVVQLSEYQIPFVPAIPDESRCPLTAKHEFAGMSYRKSIVKVQRLAAAPITHFDKLSVYARSVHFCVPVSAVVLTRERNDHVCAPPGGTSTISAPEHPLIVRGAIQ